MPEKMYPNELKLEIAQRYLRGNNAKESYASNFYEIRKIAI